MKPHDPKRKPWRIAPTLNGKSAVDGTQLKPHNSYGEPDFVERGIYRNKSFACRDCGTPQVWTASQQKWWYEVAKGDVFTQASRCRRCRKIERERRDEARRVHLEGIARKHRAA